MLSPSSATLGTTVAATERAMVAEMTGVQGGDVGGVRGAGEKEGSVEGVTGVGVHSAFISSWGCCRISSSRVNGSASCFTMSTMLSLAGNFSPTPFISLIRLVLEMS